MIPRVNVHSSRRRLGPYDRMGCVTIALQLHCVLVWSGVLGRGRDTNYVERFTLLAEVMIGAEGLVISYRGYIRCCIMVRILY